MRVFIQTKKLNKYFSLDVKLFKKKPGLKKPWHRPGLRNVFNVVRAVETNINCENRDKDIKAISGQAVWQRGALETNRTTKIYVYIT